MDKFFLSPTLKKRIDNNIEKINKGFNENAIGHMLPTSLHTKLILAQHQQEPIFYAIQKATPSACLILVYYDAPGQETQFWTGSGFLLAPGIIVTSNHVLPNEKAQSIIKVSFDGENKIIAKVNSRNPDLDIGTLTIQDVGLASLPMASREPIPGEQIAVIGAPEGWENVVSVGHVSAVDMTPERPLEKSWSGLIFIDCDIYEGSSGSMVINNSGEVIGMVMGIIGKHASDKNIGQNAVIPIYKVIQSLES